MRAYKHSIRVIGAFCAAYAALLMLSLTVRAQQSPPSLQESMEGRGLPQVTLPSTSGEGQNEPNTSAPNDQGANAIPESLRASLPDGKLQQSVQRALSMGSFEVSVMFSQEDMNNLRQVLALYESEKEQTEVARNAPSVDESDLLAELLNAQQNEEGNKNEPQILPNFYLSSVIYEKPNEWALWINRQRLSAKKPQNNKLGVTVKSVDEHHVTIEWAPNNAVLAYQRWQQSQEGSANRRNRHREAQEASVQFNDETGVFTVSLKPNQTFAADSMQVIEGRSQWNLSIQGASFNQNNPGNSMGMIGSSNPASRTLNERQAAEQLINDIKEADQAINQLY